jgi:hypothetical protein
LDLLGVVALIGLEGVSGVMTSNFTFLDLLHRPISPKLLVLPYPNSYSESESLSLLS